MRMRSSLAAVLALAIGVGLPATLLAAEVMEKQTTEKTTTYTGTVTQVDPSSSTIILRSESVSAPQKYSYTKKTTFVDEAGNTVTYEEVQNHPVTVYYTKEGDQVVVTKVVMTKPTGGAIQRKEKTTIEREETD